ncbi:hypothetical protein KIN20_036167, partial [Parelaphostrongylus tenuis]
IINDEKKAFEQEMRSQQQTRYLAQSVSEHEGQRASVQTTWMNDAEEALGRNWCCHCALPRKHLSNDMREAIRQFLQEAPQDSQCFFDSCELTDLQSVVPADPTQGASDSKPMRDPTAKQEHHHTSADERAAVNDPETSVIALDVQFSSSKEHVHGE